jgi:hypothetical protein
MLVIVEDAHAVLGSHRLIRDITYPKGSLRIIGTENGDNSSELSRQLPEITQGFQKDDLLASWAIIDSNAFSTDIKTCIQVLAGSFMSPNILFLPLPPMGIAHTEADLQLIAKTAREQRIGTIFFAAHSQVQLGQMQTVNVWIRDRSPDWNVERWIGDLDLALLTGHQLTNNWECELRLISGVDNPADVEKAQEFLHELASLARFTNVEVYAESHSFPEMLIRAPRADINIFGLGPQFSLEHAPDLVEQLGASCIFISDSGGESVLA